MEYFLIVCPFFLYCVVIILSSRSYVRNYSYDRAAMFNKASRTMFFFPGSTVGRANIYLTLYDLLFLWLIIAMIIFLAVTMSWKIGLLFFCATIIASLSAGIIEGIFYNRLRFYELEVFLGSIRGYLILADISIIVFYVLQA